MMRKVTVSMHDLQRYKVLTEVMEGKLRVKEAGEILCLSYRHTLRLKEKLKEEGLEGLLRKTPQSAPNKKITEQMRGEIIRLRRELYYDFNTMHFRDKLKENHGIYLSYESLRKILIKAGAHRPKKKRVIHRQRRRMPKAGMLVQMDSSEHHWLKSIQEKWWLICMIDDATNEVPYGRFFPKDTLFANMGIIRRFIKKKGLFLALYADKASHFKTTRHGGIHYETNPEQDDTQIERALESLGISLISANSPQAKGRIEVTFRLFQDRLIKEMRLEGIKSYKEANKFLLEKFLPYYNKKYTHEAESIYMPFPKEKNLDLIFCVRKERVVRNDNTLSFHGEIIQIPPSELRLSFARARVEVCLTEGGRIFVLYQDKIVARSILPKDNKIVRKEKKIEELLNKREYQPSFKNQVKKKKVYIPPADHPWRKSFDDWAKEYQMRKVQRAMKAQKESKKELEGVASRAN